jgi:hypothetical protein
MNSRGDLYATPAALANLEQVLAGQLKANDRADLAQAARPLRRQFKHLDPTKPLPPGVVGVSEAAAFKLKDMPRRARRAFFTKWRTGHGEAAAMEAAEAALGKG